MNFQLAKFQFCRLSLARFIDRSRNKQLDIFKLTFGDTYNLHAVPASDNPPILSGEMGHGGLALLWNLSLDDFIQPLSKIESESIMGIKCLFRGVSPFFISFCLQLTI